MIRRTERVLEMNGTENVSNKKEGGNMVINAVRKAAEKAGEHARKAKGRCGMKLALVSAMVMAAMPTSVFADVTEVTQPLDNLKTLVVSIIGAIGIIILAKNVMEFAQSYQQQDSASMNSALKGIVAGLIMAAISSVITFLGL